MLTSEHFLDYIAVELELERSSLHMKDSLVEDLGFDSILMLELILALEDLDVEIEEEMIDQIATLEDAFRLCEAREK